MSDSIYSSFLHPPRPRKLTWRHEQLYSREEDIHSYLFLLLFVLLSPYFIWYYPTLFLKIAFLILQVVHVYCRKFWSTEKIKKKIKITLNPTTQRWSIYTFWYISFLLYFFPILNEDTGGIRVRVTIDSKIVKILMIFNNLDENFKSHKLILAKSSSYCSLLDFQKSQEILA